MIFEYMRRLTRTKKILIALLIAGVITGGYFAARLSPLVLNDNTGAEKVVLLHGLGRSEAAMLLMKSALTDAGFDVYSIGYPSTNKTPDELLKVVRKEINTCCESSSETVHYVGHSLGGLLIRAHLGQNKPENLGRVVVLGTPNGGSELADVDEQEPLPSRLLEFAGPTAKALSTGPDGFPASLPAPDYPIAVIAGTRDNPVSNKWLPRPNDGMVSVESARLDGMTDFISLDLGHWELRSDPKVTKQVVAFLLNGKFDQSK